MTVHAKLMQARIKLQSKDLKKSGENKFAGYKYFELGDFLPVVQQIFTELDLCGVVSFTHEMATLSITDLEDGTTLNITSPMATAALKGAHDIQNLGAVQTYLRRYLWVAAMEIVEHDAIDASAGNDPKKEIKPPPPKVEPPKGKPPAEMGGPDGPWRMKIKMLHTDDLPAWVDSVLTLTRAGLAATTKTEDVMSIFKVNHAIYEVLKKEAPEDYEALLGDFSKRKNEHLQSNKEQK